LLVSWDRTESLEALVLRLEALGGLDPVLICPTNGGSPMVSQPFTEVVTARTRPTEARIGQDIAAR
jgi:hypothetical protein